MKNQYGLDSDYCKRKLDAVMRDISSYTPDEFARAMIRLAVVAKPIVLTEKEFVNARLKAIADEIHATDKEFKQFASN